MLPQEDRTPTPTDRFVCAINRGRDGYQVPLALYEAGLLETFVTDFYAPDRSPSWLPSALARRHVDGLPATMTRSSVAAFAIQTAAQIGRVPMTRIFLATDRLLARHAARLAQRRQAHLYCYAGYLPEDRDIPPGTRRVVFEFHPLPALQWEVLGADAALFPQVARSFEEERRHAVDAITGGQWRRADAVVCASAFTKASLVHAGCPPDRVTVVPYGFDAPLDPSGAHRAEPARVTGPCRYLFVGQGVQRKGLHHLIEAWQAAALSDAHLTLVCYRIDPGITAMIKSPTITLLGRQSNEELDALYRSADVFVLPSLVEGFGLVYLEALARGCHVIGSYNSGLPDLALPAKAATLVSAGDIQSLSAALVSTCEMALGGQLSRAGIITAAGRWRWTDFRAGIAAHARAVLTV